MLVCLPDYSPQYKLSEIVFNPDLLTNSVNSTLWKRCNCYSTLHIANRQTPIHAAFSRTLSDRAVGRTDNPPLRRRAMTSISCSFFLYDGIKEFLIRYFF